MNLDFGTWSHKSIRKTKDIQIVNLNIRKLEPAISFQYAI